MNRTTSLFKKKIVFSDKPKTSSSNIKNSNNNPEEEEIKHLELQEEDSVIEYFGENNPHA